MATPQGPPLGVTSGETDGDRGAPVCPVCPPPRPAHGQGLASMSLSPQVPVSDGHAHCAIPQLSPPTGVSPTHWPLTTCLHTHTCVCTTHILASQRLLRGDPALQPSATPAGRDPASLPAWESLAVTTNPRSHAQCPPAPPRGSLMRRDGHLEPGPGAEPSTDADPGPRDWNLAPGPQPLCPAPGEPQDMVTQT